MVKTHIQEVLPEAVTVQPGLLPTAQAQQPQAVTVEMAQQPVPFGQEQLRKCSNAGQAAGKFGSSLFTRPAGGVVAEVDFYDFAPMPCVCLELLRRACALRGAPSSGPTTHASR